ncbi:MAG: hypothetical protein A2X36_06475 [Elusimicrobia bacterium GWA2_69_24]|nr:MAG: hypothetical protein A2X36_06475 [Elusimicrobia bacterium GWA2_69_24]HBL16305.1 hypothetical protein [Elusimicrobiota bacterium]
MKTTLATIALLVSAAASARAEIPTALIQKLKPTVVNLEVSIQHGLNAEEPGVQRGTGFIVDAERGIIATNAHVVGTSPTRIKVVFEDGRTAEARRWHYDAWHDFAFVLLDKGTQPPKLEAVRLGDSFELREQQDVLMIGNNDAQEYSIKFGKTANLHLCKGERHSATIQTTFDRAGGSSGSPVFDERGEVVGIHFAGTESTSFEMRIEYLKDALEQLRKSAGPGGAVRRGEIGVDLDIMLVSDARKHFRLPEALAAKISALRGDIKRVAYVESVAPLSPAEGKLQAGDVILEVDGVWIGDDVYRFDRLVDAKVGGTVKLAVVRGGKELRISLPVGDAEKDKTSSFVLFAGAVIHDLNPGLRLSYTIGSKGVFLTQGEKGSSFSGLGREGAHTKYLLTIEGIDGNSTPDLETFIRAVGNFQDGDYSYVQVQDRWRTQSVTQARPVRLDLKYFPLRVFDWSPSQLEWLPRKP